MYGGDYRLYKLLKKGNAGINTSDATATSEDILEGKTAYAQNRKITGTIETYDGSFEGNVGEENNAKLEIIGIAFSVVSSLVKMELIDTSKCNNFNSAFQDCNKLESIPQLDTSNATSMRQMFMHCSKLKTIPLLNTSKCTDFSSMFFGCRELTEIPQIDTNNATNVASMFCSCSNLLKVPQINTNKCMYFSQLFNGCSKLETIPLLNGEKVTGMSACFQSCYNLLNLGGISNLGKAYTQKTNNYSNYTLSLVNSTKLTHESLINVINNLYDLNLTYDVANGRTLYTQSLTLGTTNKAKLTEEEIAIATSKGWNVS